MCTAAKQITNEKLLYNNVAAAFVLAAVSQQVFKIKSGGCHHKRTCI